MTKLRQYLDLLGVASREEQVARVTSQILIELEKKGRLTAPIKLSKIAGEFLISPMPIFDPAVKEGRLEYSSRARRFQIKLRPIEGSHASTKATSDRLAASETTLNRMRFTYAHELAHRFFYIRENGGWKRALQAIPDGRTGSSTIRTLLNLRGQEERMCNEIARNILVPAKLLKEAFHQYAIDSEGKLKDDFATLIGLLADHFEVSRTSMLVRILRAAQQHELEVPQRFGFALVVEKNVNGETKSHFALFLMPRALDANVRPVFSGMALEKLGQEWKYFWTHIPRAINSGSLDLSTVLDRVDKTTVCSRFKGRWVDLSFKNPEGSRRFLTWGYFSDVCDFRIVSAPGECCQSDLSLDKTNPTTRPASETHLC